MIRRYGRSAARGTYHRPRPGVYAILPVEGGVLLTIQAGDAPEFQLPGGGIDPGESPVAALHREVMEETGWRIAAPRRLAAFRRFVWMPEYGYHAEKLCTVYVARPVRRLGPPTEAGHSAHVLSCDAALEAGMNDGDAALLRRWLVVAPRVRSRPA